MSAEKNRELLQRRLELWNSGELALIEHLFSVDYVMHGPQGDLLGVEPFKQIVEGFHRDIAKLAMRYEDVVIGDDKAAYIWRITGTRKEPGRQAKTGGHKVVLTGAILVRIEDEQFVEEWRNADAMGLLVQLGVVEARERIERMSPTGELPQSMAMH
ncbi:MAG: ester cyclase [Bradymonadaceae bacterium]|nr:ester cyclase [Lujinxingiaceae bacterium]